ncbi:Hypothetical protein R9X50_00724900 [Acrodontium crateriforme]|uniref:ARID domain-containing protein n=1 Tax=Acrodontium crateriforme TaxID=150365 RepID=A0AAQ3MAJ9_9PEZI|nr:Hypothetical protein R9X50_00724900 [Acrodontium crateriforme]
MTQWPPQQPNMFSNTPNHLNPPGLYANPAQFDLSGSFAQQAMQNGNSAASTPGFPNSVIPAKRPHDGGMANSPQITAQTQMPNFPGFPQQPGGQQFPNAPTPYGHLQQSGSVNGTPSPTMQNQPFRQPSQQPQRMQNSSPSPFPGQQPGQTQANFGSQMSPGTPQQLNQPSNMPQQGQMGGWNQGVGMNPAMSMAGMPGAAPQQMNNMQGGPGGNIAYQMKLLQHQQQMRQSGMVNQRPMGAQPNQMNKFGGQPQPGPPMQNGQPQTPMNQAAAQQHQMKRNQFLKSLAANAAQQGRPFNPQPTVSGKPVDLYMLWTITTTAGGSQKVEQAGQWSVIASKLGFPQQQFPNAAEEMKQIHATAISHYERLWFAMRQQAKQEQARVNAHQMAGLGGPPQGSPTKMMQPPNQQSQFPPFQQPGPPGPPQPQATPTQSHAQLPQNGMTTPQQQIMQQQRRRSSVRKPEAMTPQPPGPGMPAPSPHAMPKVQRSPSIKQETGPPAPVMKSEEPQSTNYIPQVQSIETDGGYNIGPLYELGNVISRAIPNMPSVDEMGVIDTRAIMLSLASGIHGEVRYGLDMLAIISCDQRISFDLERCDDLLDVIIDCAEDQIESLCEDSTEVSDGIDLLPYEDVIRGCRTEIDTLQDVPAFGAPEYEYERAADRLIAITTILRNFSFYECNHRLLTSAPLIKWLSNSLRLLGTRNMLLRSYINTQDFYKDMIIFLSNITQSLELPSRDDALHILHFLLAFAPQPHASFTVGKGKNVRFSSFVPTVHRYLPPAVDCLAKLLARQDPNRTLYRSIFSASTSANLTTESPLDLLTRAFALSISVLPDRSKGSLGNNAQLRIVEARKAYLSQGMLAADILTTLMPGNNAQVARAWIDSEDGWAVGLLNLAALLSVDRTPPNAGPKPPQNLVPDTESFRLITHRALTMMNRLAEKAGQGRALPNGVANGGPVRSSDEAALDMKTLTSSVPQWDGIPQGHSILGALMMPNTDKVALGLLCGLHEMAMRTTPSTSTEQ